MSALTNDDNAATARMVAQMQEIERARAGRAPTVLMPNKDLDLSDLNILIRNIGSTPVNVTYFKADEQWMLSLTSPALDLTQRIQEFINRRDKAIFHIIDKRKPTKQELAEEAALFAQQNGAPAEKVAEITVEIDNNYEEILKGLPPMTLLICPGDAFPESEEQKTQDR